MGLYAFRLSLHAISLEEIQTVSPPAVIDVLPPFHGLTMVLQWSSMRPFASDLCTALWSRWSSRCVHSLRLVLVRLNLLSLELTNWITRGLFYLHCLTGIRSWIWWRHQMETFSTLLALCAGNSPVTGEFPAQRPVTRSCDVLFDLRLNKPLSKQWWGWWFETPSRPLWRQCNVMRTVWIWYFKSYPYPNR